MCYLSFFLPVFFSYLSLFLPNICTPVVTTVVVTFPQMQPAVVHIAFKVTMTGGRLSLFLFLFLFCSSHSHSFSFFFLLTFSVRRKRKEREREKKVKCESEGKKMRTSCSLPLIWLFRKIKIDSIL